MPVIMLGVSTLLGLSGGALLYFLGRPASLSGFALIAAGALVAFLAANAAGRRPRAESHDRTESSDQPERDAVPRKEGALGGDSTGTAAPGRLPSEEIEKLRECLRSITEARLLVPFLRSIIMAVPGKTEEAAFRLMEKFELIKRLTNEAASEAKNLDTRTVDGSLDEKLKAMSETSRRSLERERAAVTEIVELNRGNARELKQMSGEIASGLDLLKGIEEISQKSHLIALNLSVEAAHIGNQGLGFKVIATELRGLNAQTADFSQKVQALLDSLRKRSAAIIGQMAEKSETVVAEAEKGMALAAQALESLIAASSASHDYSARIGQKALSVNSAMDGVLESLQFQDITRQMLEAAQMIADELEPLMDEATARIPADAAMAAGEDEEKREELRSRLLDRAKTKGEKEAIMEVKP